MPDQIVEVTQGGLLPHVPDDRDFLLGSILGNVPYKPKQQRLVIPTVSFKFQGKKGTCGWNAVTVQKEIDEKIELSVHGLVERANHEGVVSDNGLSSLRDNQRMVQQFGIPEISLCPEQADLDWGPYSQFNLTQPMIDNAAMHRSSSFFLAQGLGHILQLLDQGRSLETGLMWYLEYNMGYGFSAPWIISDVGVNQAGGHALVCIGYDMNYYGKEVLIFQNSFGPDWADKGKFYVTTDFAMRACYAFYNQFPISKDAASFLNSHQFAFVKGATPAIYQIIGNKKFGFPDEATLNAYTDGNWRPLLQHVDQAILDKIDSGPLMDITKSPNWSLIKSLAAPERWKEVMRYIQNGTLLIN